MLFQIYGEGAIYQLLGCVLVFAGLVICNELARRSKFGGLLFFIIIPIHIHITTFQHILGIVVLHYFLLLHLLMRYGTRVAGFRTVLIHLQYGVCSHR